MSPVVILANAWPQPGGAALASTRQTALSSLWPALHAARQALPGPLLAQVAWQALEAVEIVRVQALGQRARDDDETATTNAKLASAGTALFTMDGLSHMTCVMSPFWVDVLATRA
jgi:hypothetical protein